MGIGLSLSLIAAVLGGASGAGEAQAKVESKPPCVLAAESVSSTLVNASKAKLSTWPLYEIELTVSPANRELSGRMQVSFLAPATGLESITLMLPPPESFGGASPMTVTTARARIGEAGEFEDVSVQRNEVRLAVVLPRPTVNGELITLLLEMSGQLAFREAGTLAESMGAMLGGNRAQEIGAIGTDGTGVVLLGAHPVLASYHDGAFFDSPGVPWGPPHSSLPACFIMSVSTPQGLVSAATGQSISRVPMPDGNVRHTFVAAGARRMGVVLVPSGMERDERRVGEVAVRATAERVATAKEMTRWAEGLLRHYEKRFGTYPWRRLELVEARMGGAIAGLRAPGLVLVNEMAINSTGALSGMGGGDMSSFMQELAIAHQMAHLWFGELIDVGGVSSPALEEALAWHAVIDYARTRHGDEVAQRIRRRIVNLAYHLWRAMGGVDGPAGVSLERIMEQGGLAAYTGLCDGKAPGLMEALEEAVGRATLRRALMGFAQSSRFGTTDRRELEETIRSAARGERRDLVGPLFERWLDEAHGDDDLGESSEALSRALMEELGAASGMGSAEMQRMIEEMLRSLGGLMGP